MLRADGLVVRIAGIDVLRNISIEMGSPEVLALIGRNGAGKTTTFKTLMGIYKPHAGRVVLDGVDITTIPTHARVRLGLGYVPEDMRVFPWLTARENIALAAHLTGNTDRLGDIMERIFNVFPEIRGFLDRKGYYLSGGEKRMVAISRALALGPKYLFIDEALEGLAPIVVSKFQNAIRMMKNEGIRVVIAESNFKLASKVAERIAVIERGEIIFTGEASELVKREDILGILGGRL